MTKNELAILRLPHEGKDHRYSRIPCYTCDMVAETPYVLIFTACRETKRNPAGVIDILGVSNAALFNTLPELHELHMFLQVCGDPGKYNGILELHSPQPSGGVVMAHHEFVLEIPEGHWTASKEFVLPILFEIPGLYEFRLSTDNQDYLSYPYVVLVKNSASAF